MLNFYRSFNLLLLLLSSGLLFAQIPLNIELYAQTQRADARYSGSWSYIAPDGSEYALIGAKTGTAIYNIDDPMLEELAFIPGGESNWREITVIDQHAYVVTESFDNATMQVIDLSTLPESATLVTSYDATFTRGHMIQRDIYTENPYVYVSGTPTTGGVHILDVSEPANPTEVGVYNNGYYIHDCHVRGDRLYAFAGNNKTIDIVDISDRSNPVLLNQITDQIGYIHSGWSIDDDYLFVAYETDGLKGRIFDIRDLGNIEEISRYSANTASLVHNPYIKGDFAFISHNTEGLRVVDIADPAVPVEVGFYDTYDGPSGGFFGLWSACPYFPSGKIIGGNRTDGLYVWTFNDTRAGRIYGKLSDAVTGAVLTQKNLELIGANLSFRTDLVGNFGVGTFAGDYTLKVEVEGYEIQEIPVSLQQGDSLYFDIQLLTPTNTNNEFIDNQSVTSSPNPFKGKLFFDLSNLKKGKQLIIYNAVGQEINRFDIQQKETLQLSTQDWSNGIYYWKIVNQFDKISSQGKVIK